MPAQDPAVKKLTMLTRRALIHHESRLLPWSFHMLSLQPGKEEGCVIRSGRRRSASHSTVNSLSMRTLERYRPLQNPDISTRSADPPSLPPINQSIERDFVKTGFSTMPIHPIGKDWQQSLSEDREAFILADEIGFTKGYLGEHATDPEENTPSSALFLATLVDASPRMKLGTGTT